MKLDKDGPVVDGENLFANTSKPPSVTATVSDLAPSQNIRNTSNKAKPDPSAVSRLSPRDQDSSAMTQTRTESADVTQAQPSASPFRTGKQYSGYYDPMAYSGSSRQRLYGSYRNVTQRKFQIRQNSFIHQ